jgi:putative ABC transport system permease protein
MKLLLLIFKNLRRNKLRTVLTTFAVIALVAVFSLIVSALLAMEDLLIEKNKDVKVIVSNRYKDMFPFERARFDPIITEGTPVNKDLQSIPGFHNDLYTYWHFVVCTLDPELKDPNQQFFLVATLPEKIASMTDGLEDVYIPPEVMAMVRNPPISRLPNAGIIMGEKRLKTLGKKVGDVFKAKSVSHREGTAAGLPIDMEFEIVGTIPMSNRWNDAGFMDYEYLERMLRDKKNVDEGRINWAWLKLDDQQSANAAIGSIEQFDREIKCETSATAFARFMEPMKDILWGIKWFLVPAIVIVMITILANSFSITVRERQGEIAVLKVLGFSTNRILFLILGECALVGIVAGFIGGAITYGLVAAAGGLPLGEFSGINVSPHVFWWGPAVGLVTAMVGALGPAVTARQVRVQEVFANVA